MISMKWAVSYQHPALDQVNINVFILRQGVWESAGVIIFTRGEYLDICQRDKDGKLQLDLTVQPVELSARETSPVKGKPNAKVNQRARQAGQRPARPKRVQKVQP